MSKRITSESERSGLIVEIMLYLIIMVLGVVLLSYPELEVLKPIQYVSPMLYVLGFFSLVAYFVGRKPGYYEMLIFGLINVFVASFVFVNSYYPNTGFILGNAVFIYSISNILNKGFHAIKLSNEKNINFFPKVAVTILLTLLGLLVITNLYKETTMQTLVLGYYFTVFGMISLLEPFVVVLIKNKKINNYLVGILEPDYEELEKSKEDVESKKEEKKVKAVKKIKTVSPSVKKKPNIKSKVKTISKAPKKKQLRAKK